MPPLGLYIHVPFCASLCGYCHFVRRPFDESLAARYVDAVAAEIDLGTRPHEVDSIYFGGGTPSLLTPDQIARLLEACRRCHGVSADAEITLEANPESITIRSLVGYRSAGVNRISLGVQSLDDADLIRLGRRHDAACACRVVEQARVAGFDNLSLDLILAVPGQTMSSQRRSIDKAIELAPDHVSAYLLDLDAEAPLRQAMADHGWPAVGDDEAADMYLAASDRLESAELAQYEISNFARPGRQARHNVKYWKDGEWIGFGCAAHSTVAGVRWHNVGDPLEYVERVAAGLDVVAGRRVLSDREHAEEALMMALRLTEGVHLEAARQRYEIDVWGTWGEGLSRCAQAGLIERVGGCLRLTRSGRLLASEVMSTFIEGGSTVK